MQRMNDVHESCVLHVMPLLKHVVPLLKVVRKPLGFGRIGLCSFDGARLYDSAWSVRKSSGSVPLMQRHPLCVQGYSAVARNRQRRIAI